MYDRELTLEKPRFSTGLTGYHYLVLVVACLGWSFDTMDQWLFVFVKQHALRDLLGPGVADAEVNRYVGYVQSCLLMGWATGGLFFGMVGDRLGRTRTMAITILMYAGFTGLSGLAQTWGQFAFLRFLTGMGVGGEFAAGAALVAETFPDHSRAAALGIVQATAAVGNITAGLINLAMVSFLAPEQAWRWIFAIGILPALLVFVIFMFIREPERWQTARAEALKRKSDGKSNLGSIFALLQNPQFAATPSLA
jgi:MFS family permease